MSTGILQTTLSTLPPYSTADIQATMMMRKALDFFSPVDSAGKMIRPGQRVAFNMSGSVALGRIVAVPGTARQKYKIELLQKCAGQRPGHISTVKNGTSILVLS